ncbi:PREDICTED: uncharacterized protein LOC106809658, partial [Priapulus caudatus]|uniref:Uncharacterized protein LOC106809658 n=1 Tax=Priapulus caudatus TaxID=37621 RepID=A0ABM1E7Y8_PRICU
MANIETCITKLEGFMIELAEPHEQTLAQYQTHIVHIQEMRVIVTQQIVEVTRMITVYRRVVLYDTSATEMLHRLEAAYTVLQSEQDRLEIALVDVQQSEEQAVKDESEKEHERACVVDRVSHQVEDVENWVLAAKSFVPSPIEDEDKTVALYIARIVRIQEMHTIVITRIVEVREIITVYHRVAQYDDNSEAMLHKLEAVSSDLDDVKLQLETQLVEAQQAEQQMEQDETDKERERASLVETLTHQVEDVENWVTETHSFITLPVEDEDKTVALYRTRIVRIQEMHTIVITRIVEVREIITVYHRVAQYDDNSEAMLHKLEAVSSDLDDVKLQLETQLVEAQQAEQQMEQDETDKERERASLVETLT